MVSVMLFHYIFIIISWAGLSHYYEESLLDVGCHAAAGIYSSSFHGYCLLLLLLFQ